MRVLLFATFAFLAGHLRAEEPFFKKGDVIAIVGGEDMVALSEYGYLELLLTRALPDLHLRFRNLAWEGDTVFEQRRDLNFPTWEEALEKTGATVVIVQFGQMESVVGTVGFPKFTAAYAKLLERFSGGGKRRVVIVTPVVFPTPVFGQGLDETTQAEQLKEKLIIRRAWKPAFDRVRPITDLAAGLRCRFVTLIPDLAELCPTWPESVCRATTRGDRLHLNDKGQQLTAIVIARALALQPTGDQTPQFKLSSSANYVLSRASNDGDLLATITAKNRLWFDYWRVQNWAFLAGDRTNQPSSRDHLDPQKRWFPEERERFLPLIEAKEREIDALAAKLSAP